MPEKCVTCGESDLPTTPCLDCKKPVCGACAFSGPEGDVCEADAEKRNEKALAG